MRPPPRAGIHLFGVTERAVSARDRTVGTWGVWTSGISVDSTTLSCGVLMWREHFRRLTRRWGPRGAAVWWTLPRSQRPVRRPLRRGASAESQSVSDGAWPSRDPPMSAVCWGVPLSAPWLPEPLQRLPSQCARRSRARSLLSLPSSALRSSFYSCVFLLCCSRRPAAGHFRLCPRSSPLLPSAAQCPTRCLRWRRVSW